MGEDSMVYVGNAGGDPATVARIPTGWVQLGVCDLVHAEHMGQTWRPLVVGGGEVTDGK